MTRRQVHCPTYRKRCIVVCVIVLAAVTAATTTMIDGAAAAANPTGVASAFLVPSQISGRKVKTSAATTSTSTTTNRSSTSSSSSSSSSFSRPNKTPLLQVQRHHRLHLVPSQVLKAHSNSNTDNNSNSNSIRDNKFQQQEQNTAADITVSNNSVLIDDDDDNNGNDYNGKVDVTVVPFNGSKRRRQRHRSKKRQLKQSAGSSTRTRTPTIFGNYPDIEWRCIPERHLRLHPCFDPLPDPSTINLEDMMKSAGGGAGRGGIENVRMFRQSSWQWDALHDGRCTTSQAVAALGFLEHEAGEFLGVPRSLRRGGVGAYHRLRLPALRTLQDLQDAGFFANNDNNNNNDDDDGDDTTDPNLVWTQQPHSSTSSEQSRSDHRFAAKYLITVDQKERTRRLRQIKAISQSQGFDRSIRMMWGNIQEPTAVLTALNYFWKQDPRTRLAETGMCGAGLQMNQTAKGTYDDDNEDDEGNKYNSKHNLLIGATPDGILIHPDGSVEAVEVKNHCPFFPAISMNTRSKLHEHNNTGSSGNKDRHKSTKDMKRFRLRTMEFRDKVLPHYVPQLMMEMMCVGDNCRSAIMIRQTATNGSLVLRMHRDDDWIEEMVYWLSRFQTDYVNAGVPPPPNFFFHGGTGSSANSKSDHKRYKRFLVWTKNLESKVEVLDHLPNDQIQRADETFKSISTSCNSLFLD